MTSGWKMEQDEKLKGQLLQYPSNFSILKDVEKLPQHYLLTVKNKLVQESKASLFDTEMETVRIWNLLSFLHFLLGEESSALLYNDKVLGKCADSVVGLCNKAWICLNQERYENVKHIQRKLGALRENRRAMLLAGAEVAFSLTRFGMPLYGKAISHFKDILNQCRQSESGDGETKPLFVQIQLDEEFCIWTFGLALTEKRLLNIFNIHQSTKINVTKQQHAAVAELFVSLIDVTGEKRNLQRYKARAYVEIGLLAHTAEKNKVVFPDGVKDLLQGHFDRILPSKEYFTEALRIFPEDIFVLERSGKYFRYAGDLESSIQLLKNGLTIKESSFAHHHLALSLLKQLKMKKVQVNPQNRQNVTRRLFQEKGHTQNSAKETSHHAIVKGNLDDNKDSGFFSLSKTSGTGQEYNLNPCAPEFLPRDSSTDNITQQLEELTVYSETRQTSTIDPFRQRHFSSANSKPCMTSSTFSARRGSRGRRPRRGRGNYREYYERSISCEQHNRLEWYGDKVAERHTRRGGSLDEEKLESTPGLPKEHLALMASIKSPWKPKHIDKNMNSKAVEEILYHLDKSIELSGNTAALYDTGLFYRHIDEPFKALEVFRTLKKDKDKRCSLVQLADSYEQAALCIYFLLLEKGKYPETSEELEHNGVSEYNMKENLKRSVEISCHLISKIPFLKNCWISLSILKEILEGKQKSGEEEVERLRDLASLYRKLEKYHSSIQCLKELLNIVVDDKGKAEIAAEILDLVEEYLKEKRYADAVLTFEFIIALSIKGLKVKETLVTRVYIEAAIEAMKTGDEALARLRYNVMFGTENITDQAHSQVDDVDDDAEREKYDIFILCEEDKEESGARVLEIFQQFGITATVNFHSCLATEQRLAGLPKAVRSSKRVIALYDGESQSAAKQDFMHHFQMILAIVTKGLHGKMVVVVSETSVELPDIMLGCPKLVFDFSKIDEINRELILNDDICLIIKSILMESCGHQIV